MEELLENVDQQDEIETLKTKIIEKNALLKYYEYALSVAPKKIPQAPLIDLLTPDPPAPSAPPGPAVKLFGGLK